MSGKTKLPDNIPDHIVDEWLSEPEYAMLPQRAILVTITKSRLKSLLVKAAEWGKQQTYNHTESK